MGSVPVTDMQQVQARVHSQAQVRGDYRLIVLECPDVAALSRPGQFVHVRVPKLDAAVLRRPFSIYAAGDALLSILYKQVGKGTAALAGRLPGDTVDLLGPLGNGFPVPAPSVHPVLVAGGYGVAPLSFLASTLTRPGTVFIGGRSRMDILCEEDFSARGWRVEVTTEDGSVGTRGRVTNALDAWLAQAPAAQSAEAFVCGPDGLLRAVAERFIARDRPAWLSLDKHMGCGVGACLACVQRVRGVDGTAEWVRVCREGPVFAAADVIWEGA